MLKKTLRWILPVLVLLGAYAGYNAIASNAIEPEKKPPADMTPMVKALPIQATDHKFIITSHGEIKPMESTLLSAQVSGEVIKWHPNFVAGGVVKRGEVLFSVEQDNYQAAVLQVEAELASAKASLIEEKAMAKVAQRQAKSLPSKQVTDLYLRKPQLLSAQAKVKSAQAALKRATRDLENCQVVAPYNALVVSRDIGIGQYVAAGSRVATLYNIEKAEIHIPIAGFDSVFLPRQYAGINATVTKQGIGTQIRNGTIVRDLGVVDSNTRMINIVVQIDDPYSLSNEGSPMQFGSYVEVSFTGKELKHIYKLPQELVSNQTVWVVNKESELEPRKVTVLRSEGEFTLISEGLSEKDQLVYTVPEYPKKGMKVKIAAMSQQSATDVQ